MERIPKYKTGDLLYYVNPFVFVIDRVSISFVDPELQRGMLYYIDTAGAYLLEENLFSELGDAKQQAFKMLDDFSTRKRHEIVHANPEYIEEPHD
jgi:hypothetical protein